jgi:glucose/arabinose dehydrogenase
VAQGLRQPLLVTHAGDGSNRLFAVEKRGTIKTVPDGRVFLDISERVRATGGEQGLLGLAFHPRFRDNGYLYVNYTDTNGNTVISRFGVNTDKQTGNAASEQVLLRQVQPAPNHNGGMLAFGPDGYLYIGLGDGGGANDTYRNGQNRGSLLGKLLRIDVDRGTPYNIPSDNPFVNDTTARPEVWALGLRNPWRFTFDRATGELFIADVGQGRSEWVHYAAQGQGAGANYGWPIVEGSTCLGTATCDRAGLASPIAEYNHSQGCAITGGYVYRGRTFPALQGTYIFGDFCSGRIWTLNRSATGTWQMREALKTTLAISSFGEDEAGELYLTDFAGGRVYRLTATQ